MSDKFYSDLDVLREFACINNLSVNHSNIQFKSKCNFKTARRQTNVNSRVILSFNNDKQECIVIILKDFDVNFYPTVFIVSYHNIALNESALIINGAFTNKNLGKYRVSILPLSQNPD